MARGKIFSQAKIAVLGKKGDAQIERSLGAPKDRCISFAHKARVITAILNHNTDCAKMAA
jgi:hypothetical protein